MGGIVWTVIMVTTVIFIFTAKACIETAVEDCGVMMLICFPGPHGEPAGP